LLIGPNFYTDGSDLQRKSATVRAYDSDTVISYQELISAATGPKFIFGGKNFDLSSTTGLVYAYSIEKLCPNQITDNLLQYEGVPTGTTPKAFIDRWLPGSATDSSDYMVDGKMKMIVKIRYKYFAMTGIRTLPPPDKIHYLRVVSLAGRGCCPARGTGWPHGHPPSVKQACVPEEEPVLTLLLLLLFLFLLLFLLYFSPGPEEEPPDASG
jgi:hypothetical protein